MYLLCQSDWQAEYFSWLCCQRQWLWRQTAMSAYSYVHNETATDRQISTITDGRTDGQTDRETDRQTDRQRDGHTDGRTDIEWCEQINNNITRWSWGDQVHVIWYFPSVLWHCWLGDRKGIQPVKSWLFICWWWQFDWSFACLIAPVVTTTSITRSSNKTQNGDVLVPACPVCPGKWPTKFRCCCKFRV